MWIVVNIGCIECGVSSDIVGIFSSEERAGQIAELCQKEYGWREGGQNHFDVFKMPDVDVINTEYVAAALTPPDSDGGGR